MHRHERIQTFYVAENGRPIYDSRKIFGGGSKCIWTLFPGHGCICGNQPSLWKSNHAIVPWGKRLALSTGQRPSIGTNTGQDQLPYAPSWTHPNILRCRKWTSNIFIHAKCLEVEASLSGLSSQGTVAYVATSPPFGNPIMLLCHEENVWPCQLAKGLV